MRGVFPGATAAALFVMASAPAEARCRNTDFRGSPQVTQASEGAGLVVNGGFESPEIGSYRFYDEGIPGWTVSRDSIEIINQSYGRGFQASTGSQLLALNGGGALYQDIPTRPGATYRLVLYVAREPDATGPTTLAISAGASHADYAVAPDQRGYRRETLLFEGAPGGETRISLSSTTAGEAGPLVDDVGVEATGERAERRREMGVDIAVAPSSGGLPVSPCDQG